LPCRPVICKQNITSIEKCSDGIYRSYWVLYCLPCTCRRGATYK